MAPSTSRRRLTVTEGPPPGPTPTTCYESSSGERQFPSSFPDSVSRSVSQYVCMYVTQFGGPSEKKVSRTRVTQFGSGHGQMARAVRLPTPEPGNLCFKGLRKPVLTWQSALGRPPPLLHDCTAQSLSLISPPLSPPLSPLLSLSAHRSTRRRASVVCALVNRLSPSR